MNKTLLQIMRILLGLSLVIFGLNKFLNFMPMPEEMPTSIMNFMGALQSAGYIQILGVLETVIGLLLLSNKYVALALVLLAPLSVNFMIFHLALDPKGMLPAAIVTLFNIVLLFAHKKQYEGMLQS